MNDDGFTAFFAMVFATAVVVALCMTGVNMTPEYRCESACGAFSVERVTARECVCSERRR